MMRLFIPLSISLSACVGFPSFQGEPAEAELLSHVESLRQAEIAVQVVDDFLPCSDEATAKATASPADRAWDGPDCFARLGWSAPQTVRGAYYVQVAADKSDFTVVGLADVDGDGAFMRVEATKDQAASLKSPAGVL